MGSVMVHERSTAQYHCGVVLFVCRVFWRIHRRHRGEVAQGRHESGKESDHTKMVSRVLTDQAGSQPLRSRGSRKEGREWEDDERG